MNKKLNYRLSAGERLGYGLGSAAVSLTLDYVTAFSLFFMTTIAGVDVRFAGLLLSVAVVWDAITDPIIGRLCDVTNAKRKTRRPWLIFSLIPLVGSMFMLFVDVSFFSQIGKQLFYLAAFMCFYVSSTAYCVPYVSIGVSMTDNSDERTLIRVVAQVCQYFGTICATALAPLVVELCQHSGQSEAFGWRVATTIICAFTALSMLCAIGFTKNKELVFDSADGSDRAKKAEGRSNIFKDIMCLMKMRAFRLIILANVIYQVGYALTACTLMYMIIFTCGLDKSVVSLCFAGVCVCAITVSASMSKLTIKFDKRNIAICTFVTSGLFQIGFYFAGIYSTASMLVCGVFYALASASYWTLIYAMLFDVTEVDEFLTGERRESTMIAFAGLTSKIGYAVAAAVVGMLLARAGFVESAHIQSEPAKKAIALIFSFFPGLFMILSAAVLYVFPVNRVRHRLLMVQLEAKRSGKPYNTVGFESLLK